MMTGEERHEDARIAVTHRERGVGPTVNGGYFDHAGKSRRCAACTTGDQHVTADIEAYHARRLGIAADHSHGKAPSGEALHDIDEYAGGNAEYQAPMNVSAGNGADHVGIANWKGRRLVEAGWIAQRPFDEVVHQSDGNVSEQQARDRLVDAASLTQATG